MGDVGNVLPPPYRLVENQFSLLDQTDLVFIDPVSTGYSRAVPGEKPKDFHDFKKDIESVGDFIRLYTSRYQRWTSPKYLIGESYGTTRAAGLSGYLQERHGMYLNGLVLVSSVLNFQTLEFESGNELPYLLYLPAYTAAAWYHQRLPASLQKKDLPGVLEEVESFVFDEYNRALLKGDALTDLERSRMIRKLARYTGLSEDVYRARQPAPGDHALHKRAVAMISAAQSVVLIAASPASTAMPVESTSSTTRAMRRSKDLTLQPSTSMCALNWVMRATCLMR